MGMESQMTAVVSSYEELRCAEMCSKFHWPCADEHSLRGIRGNSVK